MFKKIGRPFLKNKLGCVCQVAKFFNTITVAI